MCTALFEYLERTKELRQGESQLFISYMKPHKKVSAATISHWIKTTMAKAGLDVSVYKPHSVRAASTSGAMKAGVSLQQIMNTVGWSNSGTFGKYYHKEIKQKVSMGEKILNRHGK